MVLHAAVVEDVATNLATPFDFLLTGFHLCLLGHAVLEFLVVKHGTEKTESVLAVLGLVSRLGIFNQDFFLNVGGKRNTLQFGVDIKNFLNLLNSDWGIYKTVNNTSLLSYKGGAYQFQKNGGKKLTDTYSNLNSFNSTYSIQFSVRYIFN